MYVYRGYMFVIQNVHDVVFHQNANIENHEKKWCVSTHSTMQMLYSEKKKEKKVIHLEE